MFGIVNVNKPTGMTSRQVVDIVQRLGGAKAGHAGTLDPLATGVLVVCVGPATRLVDYVQRMPKEYRSTFLFGHRSDTEDVEGEVIELDDPPRPSPEEVERAAARLVGPIEQRPPDYSAIKVAGKRAYKLARQGKRVEIAPREVLVHSLAIVDYEYQKLVLDIRCGAGTYIRSLGRDLAESLGTAAVMSALVRTAVGSFCVENACDPEALSTATFDDFLLSPLAAVEGLPRTELTSEEITLIANGRNIERPDAVPSDHAEMAACDKQGNLLAILVPRGAGLWRPSKNFGAG